MTVHGESFPPSKPPFFTMGVETEQVPGVAVAVTVATTVVTTVVGAGVAVRMQEQALLSLVAG